VLKRPCIQQCDQHGQTGEDKATQPIEDERQVFQLPFQNGLPANQHPQGGQQNQGAEPASAGCSVESHGETIARQATRVVAETEPPQLRSNFRLAIMDRIEYGERVETTRHP